MYRHIFTVPGLRLLGVLLESVQLLFVPAGEKCKGRGVQRNRRVIAQKIIAEGGVLVAAGVSK